MNSTTSLGDLSLVNGTLLESSDEGITASPLGVNAAGDTEISQSCALVCCGHGSNVVFYCADELFFSA